MDYPNCLELSVQVTLLYQLYSIIQREVDTRKILENPHEAVTRVLHKILYFH